MIKELLPPVYQIGKKHIGKAVDARLLEIWQQYLATKVPQDYLSLYINIPYCTQRCRYCEYPSKVRDAVPDKAIDKLEERFKLAQTIFGDEPLPVLMFGGGSPSLLSPSQLDRILTLISTYWNVQDIDNAERGFEIQPHHLTDEHIDVLQASFINRLSMGIQSFDRDVLKAENRYYVSPEEIAKIYEKVKAFAHIVNADLLAGLYKQTGDTLVQDVQHLLDIGLESITIYELNETPSHIADNSVIHDMLMRVYYRTIGMESPYTYVGTSPTEAVHCNRFYKNGVDSFTYPYSPVPQGYNNIISFSLNDSISFPQHPWSAFSSIDTAYEMKGPILLEYSMSGIADIDRIFWKEALEARR